MKTIGVIGGIGPESTEIFYSEIINHCQKQGLEYPRIIINSVPLHRFIKVMREKKTAIDFLVKEIKKIEKEVDFIVIVCNTAHWVIEDLRKNCKKEILAIHEATVKKTKDLNFSKVGLVGTIPTINSQLYQKELKKYKIDSIVPERKGLKEIDRILVEEVCQGKIIARSKKFLLRVIKEFQKQGAEAVILASTDLPLILKEKESPLPSISSVHVLAEVAFKKVIE